MLEFERLNEAMGNLADAAGKFAIALGEAAVAALSIIDINKLLENSVLLAYMAASNDNPEWVHRAKYSKKKRIRKKYHDRIMRQYRRAENG